MSCSDDELYIKREKMKKILKITGKFLLLLFIVLVVLIGGIFIYNKIMLASEGALIEKPIGKYVEVDGHKMNIYTEGEGKHTLLFLSGSGTAAPVLDFKSLYSLLSSDYKIVVIEKFGYGFSDVVDSERSFETILRQDREALTKAGIEGPYILCPHSMSGIEAIMWAQNYPDEVEAIVGLDMSLPRAYDNWDWDSTIKKERLAVFARELGIVRLFYSDSQLPEKLTDKEKKIYRALAASKAVNTCIINEGLAISDAVTEIDRNPKPDIPMLMFVSDGHETGVENWIDIQSDYISDLTNAEVIELDCGHYVHNYRQDIIAEKLVEFIESL